MDQDLETAQAYVASKNYEAAFNILHSLSIFSFYMILIYIWNFIFSCILKVSKDVVSSDEEGIRIKEQAILDLGALLTETKKAKGNLFDIYLQKTFKKQKFSLMFIFSFRTSWVDCLYKAISKFS
jgi:hypothetical protein